MNINYCNSFRIAFLVVILSNFNFIAQLVAADSKSNPINLLLPKEVYGVPGYEMCIYFDNIVLVPNINNYMFDVNCKYGRQDKTRWRFIPKKDAAGNFPWSVKVIDASNKVVVEASTTIHISPADAGAGKKISLMAVGDSLTNGSVYVKELQRLCRGNENPQITFIGTHSGAGRPPKGGIAHEGYGGWTWKSFCTRWVEAQDDYRAKSVFLVKKDGNVQLDFQNYCDRKNEGKGPDFITVMLGTNDVFGATDDDIEKRIDEIFKYADILLKEFHRINPKTQIGVALTVPPAATQDAFGSNYKCGQTRWQYRRNQHRLVQRMIEEFGNREKQNIYLIPTYLNIDCENNFPRRSVPLNARNTKVTIRQINGVHPAKEGYLQIADSFYYWLKSRF